MTLTLVAIFSFSTFAQLLEKATYSNSNVANYKKHYSHNIEGGVVDGLPREFVVGNERDYLPYNQNVTGQSIIGNTVGTGVAAVALNGSIALTDFAVLPSTENQYAVGTGIYYPNSPTELSGYPFLGIYDRRTMQLLQLYYYDLSYPMDKENKNSVGLRIKYSERYNSLYISGILCENVLPEMNMNELVGRSQGFIMKINFANPTIGQAIIFTTDDLPIIPLLCAVTDIEIDQNEQEIAFTGINTKQATSGYYSPFAGKIDMNLNLLWSKTFSFGNERYSGVDVEYSQNNNFLMLMNSDSKDFAVMEISSIGAVLQQPVKYHFSYSGDVWPARSHIMHYNKTNIFITGNLYEAERTQRLYSYEILNASNLLSGASNFQMYSYYPIPQGKQVESTTYWAPENSILSNGYLSIVGIYNNIGQGDNEFGYCLIHQAGFEKECLLEGDVTMTSDISSSIACLAHTTTCRYHVLPLITENTLPTIPHQLCPTHEKSAEIMNNDLNNEWKINATTEDGVVIMFNNNQETSYLVNIYTTTGQLVHSEKVTANGQKAIYLKFQTSEQIYLVNVNDGTKSETKKVVVLH